MLAQTLESDMRDRMLEQPIEPVTKSEHIREQYARGVSRGELCEQYGASLVSHALTHMPKRLAGRPRKLARCEHCGQPMPVKRASAAAS